MDESSLGAELDRLVGLDLLLPQGDSSPDSYLFKHALIQDAAYESLLRSTRQGYHERIARALVEQLPERAGAQPELLAHHFAGAGMSAEAIEQWSLAGQRAIGRSAYTESIRAFQNALDLLVSLPQGESRDRREIELRANLGLALISTMGFSAQPVEHNFSRAHHLSEQFGDVPPMVLYGIWAVYLVRSDREATKRLAATFRTLESTSKELPVKLMAVSALGIRNFFSGRYSLAQEYFAKAKTLSGTQDGEERASIIQTLHGFEGFIYPFVYLGWCEVAQGFPERGWRTWRDSLNIAEGLKHPAGVVLALVFGCSVARDVGDVESTRALAERATTISLEHGFTFWLAGAMVLAGWAEAQTGSPAVGIPRVEQGLGLLYSMGAHVTYPYYKSALAEAYLFSGRHDDALRTIDETIAFTDGKLGRNYLPAMFKIRGDILSVGTGLEAAEQSYRRSMRDFGDQGAKLGELQAATGLARVLAQTSRREEARVLLSGLYGWFKEGFDMAALKAARGVLDTLI